MVRGWHRSINDVGVDIDVTVAAAATLPENHALLDCLSMAKDTGLVCECGVLPNDDGKSTEGTQDEFVVSYRGRYYDIREFLGYHPGGRKMFGCFKGRSLDKAFDQNPHSKGAFHLLQDFTVNEQERCQEYEVNLAPLLTLWALIKTHLAMSNIAVDLDEASIRHTRRRSVFLHRPLFLILFSCVRSMFQQNLVDWNAPILRQVGTLGERYWEWANLPVNRQIRLFQSNFLETLSITPWYFVLIVWIPVLVYFLHSGYRSVASNCTGNTLLEALVSYIFGILVWSILEYTLHRKLFHFKPPATSKILISLHFVLHGVHHKAPLDNRRLVFPPVIGLLVAKLLWYIYGEFFSETSVYFIAAGTTTGYVCYDLMHYYLHHGAPKAGTYLYTMKRNHNYHHFLHHDLGFGISSKLWDQAFGTTICLRRLAKPIEW